MMIMSYYSFLNKIELPYGLDEKLLIGPIQLLVGMEYSQP